MVLKGLLKPFAFFRKTHLWLVLITIVLLLGLASPVLADNLDNWQWRNPLPQGNSLLSITYGNNTFVAVGDSGTILTSPNGISWTNRSMGTTDGLCGVTYGNNTFVGVGDGGTILTSTDGITWVSRTSGMSNRLSGVTYGNNTFVGVGDGGTILTSTDGITWVSRTSGMSNWLSGVTYGKNNFVAVGYNGAILTSPDGLDWTSRAPGTTKTLRGVTYGNNAFVAVGGDDYSGGIIFTSTNGITWANRTSDTTTELDGVSYINNTFVAVGGDFNVGGTILTSPDGGTWTSRTTGTPNYLSGVAYGNNTYVTVGYCGTILTSPNDISWTNRTLGTTNDLTGVTYGNNTFVAVGDSGTILTSKDGISWTNRTSGTTNWLSGVTYGHNTFVAVSWWSGGILTSPDGIAWTSRTPGTTDELSGVTYGNNTFVAVSWSGMILTSPDGIAWTSRISGTTNTLRGVTYGNNAFVAVGYNGTILTSPDGITWTNQSMGTTDDLLGVTYGNNTFVAVGGGITDGSKILTSPDGITWTSRTSTFNEGLEGVIYGNNSFVVVGGYYDCAILTSPDGITWTSRTPGTTNNLSGITYGNNTYVAVGFGGTILQSDTLNQLQLTITTTSLVSGSVGSPYNVILSAGGGTSPYTWSAIGLPMGLSINSSTGVISGTPTSGGTSTVTISVKDSVGQSAIVELSLNILEVSTVPIVINSNPTDQSQGVDPSKSITITFNENITQGISFKNITLKDTKGKIIKTANAIKDDILTIKPTRLAFGTNYTITIPVESVKDINGNALAKNYSFSFTTMAKLPQAPTGLKTKTISSTEIDLSWKGVTGYKYLVYRSDNKDSGYKLISGSLEKASYNDIILEPNKIYWYKIKALNGDSVESAFTTPIKALTMVSGPTNVQLNVVSSNEIDLNWNPIGGAKSYNIYGTNSENGTYKKVGSSKSKSFKCIGLKPSTTYWYKVTAVTSIGEGDYSESISATTKN